MTLIAVCKDRRVYKVVFRPTVHQAAVPKLCTVRKTELVPGVLLLGGGLCVLDHLFQTKESFPTIGILVPFFR